MATVGKTFAGGAPATVLAAPITAGAPTAGATFTVAAATGTNYPTTNFVVKINAGNPTEEKIFCSSRSGDVFTVGASGRGYDGTAAADHGITEEVVHELDAATMTAITDHVDNDTADDHSQYTTNARAQALIDASIAAIPAGTGTVYFTNLGAALSQSFTTIVDITGLTAITFTANGTSRYRLHFHGTAVGAGTVFELYEGSTLIGILSQTTTTIQVDGFWEWKPSAASHTYKVRGRSVSGTGRLDTNQASGQDTYLSVENIGTV